MVADLIGRSESWLSQVERGIRSVDRLPVLMDLAEVLHVEVEALLGRSWECAPNGNTVPDKLDTTRRYLNGYPPSVPGGREPPSGGVELAELVRRGHVDYQAARYSTVAAELPTVLAGIDALARARGRGRRSRRRCMCRATSLRRSLVLSTWRC